MLIISIYTHNFVNKNNKVLLIQHSIPKNGYECIMFFAEFAVSIGSKKCKNGLSQ